MASATVVIMWSAPSSLILHLLRTHTTHLVITELRPLSCFSSSTSIKFCSTCVLLVSSTISVKLVFSWVLVKLQVETAPSLSLLDLNSTCLPTRNSIKNGLLFIHKGPSLRYLRCMIKNWRSSSKSRTDYQVDHWTLIISLSDQRSPSCVSLTFLSMLIQFIHFWYTIFYCLGRYPRFFAQCSCFLDS